MKILLKLFCIVFLLISCKDEIEINTGTYVSENIEIGTIKLYTKSGEIKDSKTISNFVKVHDKIPHFFIQNPDSNINVKDLFRIVILPANQALFIYSNDSTIYDIKSQNQILYLESKDTTIYRSDVSSPFYEKMLKYSPFYSETLEVPHSSYVHVSYTKLKPCLYVTLSKNTITFPLLTYHYFQSIPDGTSYNSLARRDLNNIFNEKSTNLLNVTDTIAVQQNYLKLYK